MNVREREEAIESLAHSLHDVWLKLLSDGLNHPVSPEHLRLTIIEAARQLDIGREVYDRASELMRGER